MTSILSNYNEDDYIIIKLDIDTSHIEIQLANQLFNHNKLIDQFYFEHHVELAELMPYWGASASGSVLDSLLLFQSLRKNGIAAHYWP